MSWNEGAFGKLLCKRFSKFKFTRIPNITREYFITTRGLVIRGGQKGPGDLLEWDKIKEPGTSDGLDILGFDIAGTVKFNTPITLTVVGRNGKATIQEFPQMSTKFYYMLLSALHVANMFKDDASLRTQALLIWDKRNNDRNPLERGDYIKIIANDKINKIFLGKDDYKNAALEMYSRGAIKFEDLKKTPYEVEQMVKKYINSKEGMGFKTDARTEFRNSVRADVTPNNNTAGTTGKWGSYPQHKRFELEDDEQDLD